MILKIPHQKTPNHIMRIKPTKLEVYETKALGILGGSRPPRDRADLRQLPHQLIHQGARMPYARLYQLEDVLALRRARSAAWQAEVKALRLLTDQRRADRESNASTSTGGGGTSKV